MRLCCLDAWMLLDRLNFITVPWPPAPTASGPASYCNLMLEFIESTNMSFRRRPVNRFIQLSTQMPVIVWMSGNDCKMDS